MEPAELECENSNINPIYFDQNQQKKHLAFSTGCQLGGVTDQSFFPKKTRSVTFVDFLPP